MKKKARQIGWLAIVTILFILTSAGNCMADDYGNIKLTGVDIAGSNYVFYASDYTQNGYNSGECAKTDWWWPSGTKYAFWLPKDGNGEIYRHMMAAYLTGRKVFVNATPQTLSYANGIPCLLKVGVTFSLGDY